jgi:hypothetical protein
MGRRQSISGPPKGGRGGGGGKAGGSARKHRKGKAKVHPSVQQDSEKEWTRKFAAQTAHLPIDMGLTLSQLYLVLSVMNATKQPESHYYLPPWVPYEQILCAEYRSSVLDDNRKNTESVSVPKLSSKTEPASEPASEPAKALGTTAAEAAVVECKENESDDKHTAIGAMVSVSAATTCEQILCAEYRSSVLDNNKQHSQLVSVAKLWSKTEPESESPAKALGTPLSAEAVVIKCKDTTIGAMVSVSAAPACEHPVTAEGDVALTLNQDQALAECKATTTGESVVVMKPTGTCSQHTRPDEAASGLTEVSTWEYNPARWVIRLLIVYMFISNLMLVQ